MLWTYVSATAVNTKLSSKRDGRAEPEEGQKTVEGQWKESNEGVLVARSCRDQVQKAEHCERSAEHRVVDDSWVGTHSDHVTGQGHDEQGPKEFETTKAESEHLLHCHCDGSADLPCT